MSIADIRRRARDTVVIADPLGVYDAGEQAALDRVTLLRHIDAVADEVRRMGHTEWCERRYDESWQCTCAHAHLLRALDGEG